MTRITSTSIIAVFSIVITVAIMCSTIFAGAAGAQFFPQSFGYDGFGGYGNQAFDGTYGMPFGTSGFPQTSYGLPSYAGSQMPYSMPSYATQSQVPYTAPAYTSQQLPLSNQPAATGTAGMLTIPGLEGLVGFMPGDNKLSLAVIPVTQQNNQMGFQVIGFAISSQSTGQAAVYSLSQPLAGVIDPTQNTLQIDLSNLANNVNQAGFITSDQAYNTIRSSPQVIVIDVDMTYQGAQGSQTIFNVNSVSIIPPDGRMQAFAMQQPTQLIIDSQSMRIYMVAFPQMISAFNTFYGATYPQVLPIVYVQPIPVLAPIFVPFLQPFPIFFSSFVSFNPFFFGDGFVSFFSRTGFGGGFPIHDRNFGIQAFNQFAGARGISAVGGRVGPGGVGTSTIANIGSQGIGPSGIASARAPGVSAGSITGPQAGTANVRAPGVSIGSSASPTTGLSNVRAPGVSLGSNAGVPSISAGQMPSFSGLGHGINGIGAGMGAGMGGGVRIGGGRR